MMHSLVNNKMAKKIVIVGAGPAGLGAAYSLAGKADVTLIEQGKSALGRRCPSNQACVHCNKKSGICDKGEGVGGAGSFADGKFIFETIFGDREVGSNLLEYVGTREEEKRVIGLGRQFFENYGIIPDKFDDEKMLKARDIEMLARQHDMGYILSSQTHVGTDKLPQLINSIEKDLIRKGVNIITQEKAIEFDEVKVITDKREYEYDSLILTSGRKGADWLEKVLKKNKIDYGYREVDIGFRIETDAAVLQKLCEISRDVKLSLRVPGNGDLIRTFCVCPNGFVGRETYERAGFNLVNGESHSDKQTPNSNFALLVSIPLTHKANCNSYSDSIAKTFYWAGTDQPVIQRLGELKSDRRSRIERLPEFRIKPTLQDVYFGDIGLAMPYRIVRSLLYGIDQLSAPGLMHGLNQYSTLLYAPEMKRNGLKVNANEYLRVKDKVYIAGDGPGITRGIVAAAASGARAAEGIIKEFEL
jgi:uncharacterized protein